MTHKVKELEFDELPRPIDGAQLTESRLVKQSPFLGEYVGHDLTIFGVNADGTMVSFAKKGDTMPRMCARVSVFQDPNTILERMVTA